MPHLSKRTFLRSIAAITMGSPAFGQILKPAPKRIIDGRIIYGDFVYGADGAVVDGPIHNGVEIQIDLPVPQHIKNFGAPADGLGLCVFASMSMAARWHHVRELQNVIHKIQEGGGYPEKVDRVFKQFAPKLDYVQYEGTDPSILDKALSEGRMPGVTLGYGERYQMQTIHHMVDLVHLDANWAAVLDNNFPGTYEWMSRKEFLKRWIHPSGKGWAYVMLVPGPPPIPHN
ncbi:hypothetical protein SAMN05444166_4202 [Singulisphaera sp. GP187]|uniref:hypothetical protein n=1 Tax=Singulisphaera sp. GP187 TaxID=1882752 RepID=UPI00092947A6|nr:hypothetical protein [Singulisphaera sp. GP187]SIO37582.1 hypothetical protein SAMN05444166_4202 [Singulisphaera sp. GP187]